MAVAMKTVRRPVLLVRLVMIIPLLLAVLFGASILSLSVGQGDVGFAEAVSSLGRFLSGDAVDPVTAQEQIVIAVRLPRVILGLLVGMLLASVGVALQGLLLNPLADPYTIGVSSGAALGASLAVVAGGAGWAGGFGLPAAAFITAIAAVVVVYSLATRRGKISIHSFLLAGIVVGSFLWALLTFLLTLAGQDLATIIYWLLGNLSSPDPWGYVRIVLPFAVLGLAVLFSFSRDLNVYASGEEGARHLGVDTEALKIVIIVLASLITAAAVSVSGIIGFVGLIVPHTARRMFGSDHRILLPTSALLGATLLVMADTAARTVVSSGELPVGVVTALIGAPFFCYLLKRR